MRFTLRNLGPIKQGDVELNNLTILCGNNNTGKLYIANSIYGFIKTSNTLFEWKVPDSIWHNLEENKHVSFSFKQEIESNLPELLDKTSHNYTGVICEQLAISEENLEPQQQVFLIATKLTGLIMK